MCILAVNIYNDLFITMVRYNYNVFKVHSVQYLDEVQSE